MSSSKRSKLPEPVKRSSFKDKLAEKGKDKKESKNSRTKSSEPKKEKERSSSKDRSRDSREKEKTKEKEKEKERRKSLIPSVSKDRSASKEKSKSKRDAPPKAPTPPPPEVEAVPKPLPPPPTQQEPEEEANSETDESERSPPDSSKENRQEPPRLADEKKSPPPKEERRSPKEDYGGEVEEERIEVVKKQEDETPMMRRLQSRQGGRRMEEAKKVAQNARVLSATERKISFSNTTMTVSAAAVSESNDRYRMLRNLIGGLERKSTVLLAHPPVKDYDFYIEMFGNSGKAQTFTQTGEDNVTEECQTEQEEMITKWTQQPAQAYDDVGWGAEGGGASVKYGHDDDDLQLFRGPSAAQSEALHRFMDVAAGVMFDLLASTRHSGEYFSMECKSKFSFSAGYNNFQLLPTANESKITAIARSKTDEYSFLCAFHVLQSNLPTIIKRSLLVEYPLDRNAPPQRLYLAQSVVNSASYSEDGTILLAGMQDGSIVAWDLYESTAAFDHRCPWLDSKTGIALREPSFDTSFMSSIIHDDRTLEIVAVHVVSSGGGSVFQLCALDECGTISTWTVERQAKPPGAQGCRPGSRLLLTLSSIVRPDSSIMRQSPSGYIMANCMAALPEDQMQLLIGTDVGFIASMSRGKGAGHNGPRLYKSPMHAYGEVLCMRFSPFELKILATGLSTGSISIHKAGQVGALVILTPPNSSRTPVTLIEWSPMQLQICFLSFRCPTVFYTMHESGHVLTWNLSIGKIPQAINDLSTEKMGRAVCSFVWHEKASARESSGIGYLEDGGGLVTIVG
ncbi:wdr-60 [Pristionchus pacificus]|uniref:WD_REPEATS_REGION domain-containing protein n=1 Tax=Pristionchus pacificus TaxID=54126 RepID=A0A2A6CEF5_PRIPA|nr:wdr-60 [Pristionchus pacificus]|eukprot:PDM76391.1 hypothetical protein PRIPAC_39995 [Pristionchus pacificus]